MNNNNNNSNPQMVNFTFVEEDIPQYTSNNNETPVAARGRARGRPRGSGRGGHVPTQVPSRDQASVNRNTTNDGDSGNNEEESLIDSIDNGFQSPEDVVRVAYDEASTWVIIELAEEYLERVELSSSPAHKIALYREMLDSYNSNTNTNGRRTLRSIRNKWNELMKIFRRRKDQQTRTGQAPQAPWIFHERLSQMGERMATVTPPTVYTSFMRFGNTVDNRADMATESSNNMRIRTYSNRQRRNPSVQQFSEAIRELSDYNYTRAAPEREAAANFMSRFLESRERMLENQRVRTEQIERRTVALERMMAVDVSRLAPPPPPFPQPPSVNESSSSNTGPSNRNKRRRLSI